MGMEVNRELYNFDKDFKGLPAKNRITLIKAAKTLLKVQKEDFAILAASLPINEGQKLV
jgi:hypothetical protein